MRSYKILCIFRMYLHVFYIFCFVSAALRRLRIKYYCMRNKCIFLFSASNNNSSNNSNSNSHMKSWAYAAFLVLLLLLLPKPCVSPELLSVSCPVVFCCICVCSVALFCVVVACVACICVAVVVAVIVVVVVVLLFMLLFECMSRIIFKQVFACVNTFRSLRIMLFLYAPFP